jgi:hypothetical protein
VSFLRKSKYFLFFILAELFLALMLFNRYEFTGETWGYWFFSRIFEESGQVQLPGRGPGYSIYLSLFSFVDYPFSVTLEYFVTNTLLILALFFAFRKYIGGYSFFASILWLPFLQSAEPSLQVLALACALFSLSLRRKTKLFSYVLLYLSYLMRPTYILFLLLFLGLDAYLLLKKKIVVRRDSVVLAVFVVVAILFSHVYILSNQTSHRWNNAWLADADWFPGNTQSLFDTASIGHANWKIQEIKGLTCDDPEYDSYFTNKKYFNNVNTFLEFVVEYPLFVAKFLFGNVINYFVVFGNITSISFLVDLGVRGWFYAPLSLVAFLVVVYGAFRASWEEKDISMLVFLLGAVLATIVTIIAYPKPRYFHTLMPVFILASFWLANKISNLLSKAEVKALLPIMIIVTLTFFSPLRHSFAGFRTLYGGLQKGEVKILERENKSLKVAFPVIQKLLTNCHGIISMEHNFFGAFSNVPVGNHYSIWGIPPFGSYSDKNGAYKGLTKERINCVFISKNFEATSKTDGDPRACGFGNNAGSRYSNYVLPYSEHLLKQGAQVYEIPKYGKAIILSD